MRFLLVLLLLALPQMVSARVYMCVDEATGKTVFTDQGCETASSREEVKVDAANLDSGSRYRKSGKRKTWNSERDERKTGLDYNAQRRDFYERRATAQVR
jgi:hypothetical protein